MRRLSLAGIFTLILCLPSSGMAQTPQEKALAKKRYKVGEQLYDISKYSQALEEFEKAYKIYPLPDLLYNIARCHEVLANLDKAIETYRLFLEKKPDSPHAPLVKTRIKSLEERLAEKKAEQEKAAAAKAEAEAEKKPEPPPPVKPEMKEEKPTPVITPPDQEPAAHSSKRSWR